MVENRCGIEFVFLKDSRTVFVVEVGEVETTGLVNAGFGGCYETVFVLEFPIII